MNTKFYMFRQNNSGGEFDFDEQAGITKVVVVEAYSHSHANSVAKEKGIYFDGCDEGRDCPCCGDRWYPVYESDGDEFPSVYGEKLGVESTHIWSGWMPEGRETCVHYLDGRLEWYNSNNTRAKDHE